MDLQNSANHLLALPIIPALKRQLLRSRGRKGVYDGPVGLGELGSPGQAESLSHKIAGLSDVG
jgi:hypothetical protein